MQHENIMRIESINLVFACSNIIVTLVYNFKVICNFYWYEFLSDQALYGDNKSRCHI